MALTSRTSLLQRLLGRSAPVRDEDPADMGTAIGLDFMLDQPPLHDAGSAPVGEGSDTADWPDRRWAV